MIRFLKRLLIILLVTCVAFTVLLFTDGQMAERFPSLSIWREPRLAEIWVYGEHALFTLEPGFGNDVQIIRDTDRKTCGPASYINQGFYLPDLEDGLYHLYAADLCIRTAPDYLLEGYTITRRGQNKHYRFQAEDSRLVLAVSSVPELPEDVYDLIIDAGHGGNNIGANPEDRQEKDENLQSSLYMAELFGQYGLKVALTRSGDYIPGQPGVASADVNPYVENGRVDLSYQAQAKYLISNHLNASVRAVYRGYQLYTSVRADKSWPESVAKQLDAYGHTPNDDFLTFGRLGIYKRYTQDDADTGSDYYYILRETGGLATDPRRMLDAFPARDFRQGAEAMLVEYLFLDNRHDREYWDENWRGLVEAVVAGCVAHWGL